LFEEIRYGFILDIELHVRVVKVDFKLGGDNGNTRVKGTIDFYFRAAFDGFDFFR
jgi:hypothetical protein